MSISTNNRIDCIDIINTFVNNVKNAILNNTYHLENIPTIRGHQCVPSSIMDKKSSFQNINPKNNTVISGSSLYNSLYDATSDLTRVGTFSTVVVKKVTRWGNMCNGTSYQNLGSLSGKVIFTKDYVRPHDPDKTIIPTPSGLIGVNDILNLISSCLVSWTRSDKYHYTSTFEECHDSCHSNCHSNCHDNCHDNCHNDCHHNPCNSDYCAGDICYGDCPNCYGQYT